VTRCYGLGIKYSLGEFVHSWRKFIQNVLCSRDILNQRVRKEIIAHRHMTILVDEALDPVSGCPGHLALRPLADSAPSLCLQLSAHPPIVPRFATWAPMKHVRYESKLNKKRKHIVFSDT